jgi:hypothetical protein
MSQRGVGCTHVVNPPFVILYFFGPIFSTVSPKKYTIVSWPVSCGANAPGRGVCRCGWTVAKPLALKNVPSIVFVLNTARSAAMRLVPCASTTLPVATARFSFWKNSAKSA